MNKDVSDKPKIHRNHNVYILGAGFSRDAGLPLILDFLDQMRESVNWLEANGRQREREAVEKVFDFRRRAAGSAYRMRINPENIEELFSLASAIENTDELDYVSLAIAATLDYAKSKGRVPRYQLHIKHKSEFQSLLSELNWRLDTSRSAYSEPHGDFFLPVYHFYAGLLSGHFCTQSSETRNTVITFNYDTLLEDSLDLLRIPYNYGNPIQMPVNPNSDKTRSKALPLPILKLHGSVNWSLATEKSTSPHIDISPSYRDLINSGSEPFLLPPTWRKVFTGSLAEVWSQAVEAITEATRIIIVGFSLPLTDVHFRYLLAAGLQENISLRNLIVVNYVDPNKFPDERAQSIAAVQKNFKKIFQPHFSNHITWRWEGTQQVFGSVKFLRSIERELATERFGELSPYPPE